MTTEHCPVCNHELEEHTVNEDGQLFQLFYCDSCCADYLPVGMAEWLMLRDEHGTRPVAVQPATLPEA